MRLEGKVAIVTGGAGGIGRGIVQAFIKEGARVLFVDINEEAGRALEAGLDGRARFLNTDISRPEAGDEICAAAVEAFGSVAVLVNNAQVARQVPFLEHTQELFDLAFGTGFYPTFRLMKACYPQLKATRGSVINFASGAGLTGMPTQTSYAAAKEAIRAISRVAANEWGPDGINVNVICPLAATEGVAKWRDAFPEMAARTLAATPLGRFGDPEADIGRVAVFLASDDAGYMTGQTLMADGGTLMLR